MMSSHITSALQSINADQRSSSYSSIIQSALQEFLTMEKISHSLTMRILFRDRKVVWYTGGRGGCWVGHSSPLHFMFDDRGAVPAAGVTTKCQMGILVHPKKLESLSSIRRMPGANMKLSDVLSVFPCPRRRKIHQYRSCSAIRAQTLEMQPSTNATLDPARAIPPIPDPTILLA